MSVRVELGDCLDVLERMPAESVDAVITDPPYGLEFMGEDWDRPWAVGTRNYGHTDGSERVPGPQHGSSRNPCCRSCRKHKRGADRCQCEAPDFDESPAEAMRAFQAWCEVWARACLRVLKPGGFILAFGGTRTSHRLACAIEDAGFEIRDRVLTLNGHVLGAEVDWLYGSGWPKSHDVSKGIDRANGATRETVGSKVGQPGYSLAPSQGATVYGAGMGGQGDPERECEITAPATDDAKQWEGWGTALKPAHEPIVVARKPMRGTTVEQVLATGTGALNIDATRISTNGETVTAGLSDPANRRGVVGKSLQAPSDAERNQAAQLASLARANALGRWPANLVLLHAPECERVGTRRVSASVTVRRNLDPEQIDGGIFRKRAHPNGVDVTYGDGDGLETIESWACVPECPVFQLDSASGELRSGEVVTRNATTAGHRGNVYSGETRGPDPVSWYGDRGGASRFFYSGKASPVERDAGLEDLPLRLKPTWSSGEANAGAFQSPNTSDVARNVHPTVKPIDLMRWLIRLVVPAGGTLLDPFGGSGTTGCAAALEGVSAVIVERKPEFHAITEARVRFWERYPPGTPTEAILAEVTGARRSIADAAAQRDELAAAGQLDLLASGEA